MASARQNHHVWSMKSILPIAILLSLASAQSNVVADFSLYPAGSRSCLSSAATSSQCSQSSVAAFNSCVCGNGGSFIDTSAACLGKSDQSDLTTVYAVLSRNCADSNTPINYSLDKFLSQASVQTATASVSTSIISSVMTVTQSGTTQLSTQLSTMVTSVAPSPIISTITIATTNAAGQTTAVATVLTLAPLQSASQSAASTTSSAAARSSGSSGGLSQGAAIGIGVGVGVPIAFALFGILGVLLWRRKKSRKTDGNMAPPEDRSAETTLHSDSPYGGHAGVAAYKQSPTPSHPQYASNVPPYDQAAPYKEPPSAYGSPAAQAAYPVELSGVSMNSAQELPGDYGLSGTEKRPH